MKPYCCSRSKVAFDWEIRISDFAIEREIRKQISPPRNPSSGWISIKKSKSGFHGFPFYRSMGKSEKGICKTVLVNSGLLSVNYACAVGNSYMINARARPLFLRTVFQILLRISPNRTVKMKIKKQISQR